MPDDMTDIICSDEQFKKKITFRNKICAADKKIFAEVAEKWMKEQLLTVKKIESFIHKLETNLRN